MNIKLMSNTERSIIKQNEADANKKVAMVMFFIFCIYSFMYILNLIGIFVIPKKIFTFAYITSSVILLLPLVFNKIFSPDTIWLKSLYILGTAVFLFIAIVTLSYHSVVVYALPIAVAGIYFSRREVLYSIFLTCVVSVLGQIVSYKLNLLHDANFISFNKMIIFGIIPRVGTLLAFAALLYMVTRRTSKLIATQINSAEKIKKHNLETVMLCATLLESHDHGTGNHLRRTKEYVNYISLRLKANGIYEKELTEDFIENLVLVFPLHDIGKASIKADLLDEARPLTSEEFEIIKKHSLEGYKIINTAFSDDGSSLFKKLACEVTRYHHEKWDGSGYPDKLRGDEIPLSARIMAVADVFDAISSDRPYRKAMTMDECFSIIKEGAGTHFDPIIAKVFLESRNEIISIRNTINLSLS